MADEQLLEYLENFISEERKQRFLEILKDRTKLVTVAIEDLYQMHNTSAVIRSCEVFGIQEAHVIESRFGKKLDDEIAMGAQKWVDVHRHKSTRNCIEALREDGYKIIATTPHNDSNFLVDFEIEGKTALLFGTERNGLSQEAIDMSDGFLKIPMLGFTESLNISVSAAIIIQDLVTKMRNSNIEWKLTDDEKLEKRLDWTKKSVRSIEDILKRYETEIKNGDA
ncbi:TrmH family RNA methyltransferase [Zobellia barbeyronii]|uniref:tRNA (guanosine(18)-2'-O)-methyltransferase n=1 Tax=Zobellia barbeyronii TaxID=2748009 RepID=A0ABS5WFU0_9FLAO|nr:RNA methyltransferase [Zobellia barbeyronii]MBT2161047.1 RNA methyltransferase [Zobellia barbeyronii]